jgi:hypothetical protein
MPQSIYDNGGVVGATLDFGDTDKYVLTPSVTGSITYVGGDVFSGLGTADDIDLVDLGTTAAQDGDLVLVFFATNPDDFDNEQLFSYRIEDQSGNPYIELANIRQNDAEKTQLQVGYRILAPGDTDNQREVVIGGGSADFDHAWAAAYQIWRGVDSTNPLDVSVRAVGIQNTARPTPPPMTPVTDGAVIVVAGAGGHNEGSETFTAPYLSNFLTAGANDIHDALIGVGWTAWTGGTFTPTIFGWTSPEDSNNFSSIGISLALRPPVTPAVFGNQKNSGIWSLSSVLETVFTPVTTDFLVIAGGGGGGNGQATVYDGQGGGAGGYRTSAGPSGGGASAESSLILKLGEPYTVTVGAGGASNANGSDSVFSTITSIGGGRGRGANQAGDGGSGGGGGGAGTVSLAGVGTINQGFEGGGFNGGGGGAGEAGNTDGQGQGGDGVSSSITGSAVVRAGGGGSSATAASQLGGDGGGGNGNTAGDGFAGSINTGSGGGGARATSGSRLGGAGGSGIIVIKYPDNFTLTIGPGLTSSTSTSGGFKTTTFTAGTDTVSFS